MRLRQREVRIEGYIAGRNSFCEIAVGVAPLTGVLTVAEEVGFPSSAVFLAESIIG